MLSENKSISSSRLDCEVLLAHLLKCERIDLIIKKDTFLEDDIKKSFFSLVERRRNNEPVSYLINQKEFMSLDFFVTPGVLIPRPETEMLVEFLIENLKDLENPLLIDLCTGSGAIGVSVAHYLPNAFVTVVDKYDVCVNTAQKHAEAHGVSDRVHIKKKDVLTDKCDFGKYHALVSNPPYIQNKVLSTLPDDVKNYEPQYALDGGDDGLCFYRRITELAKDLLIDGGILVFEIGFDQGEQVKQIIKDTHLFQDVKITKDFAGQDRMITAIKKG